ncbi:MAG: reverse transcriptase domain-containing protein [Chloroflexota bacterium]|nr:reverse transcriptase domain-containing protein [Chloroflexota bacterium]
MISACDALDILRTTNRTTPTWINRQLYRLLYNPTLHVLAYERLKSKPGNMTPGSDGKTLDGFSRTAIQTSIALLRTEHYQPTPVRRVYIPKTKGWRPLGVPSPRDKLIQECVRLILEAIYEPTFHDNSHGFRPGRSCHTALESLRRNWVGTKWVLKVDIAECFERIDHHRLLDILREKIDDDRFLNLIRKFLTAGYLENWIYHQTYSGTPQGSVLSPILTNVYLAKLDHHLADLCQRYSQGQTRKFNAAHGTLLRHRQQVLAHGASTPTARTQLQAELQNLNRRILETPVYDYHDPTYTRVKFLRYADDVIVGIIGPKALAEQVKDELATFLHDSLKLELNHQKTRIIHLATEKARFLGYEFKTARARLRRRNLRHKGSPYNVVQTVKTGSGNILLLVPLRDLSKKLQKYMVKGQPASIHGYANQPADHIVDHYNGVIRGWYNYYQLAVNVCSLNYARYVLLYSLAKTLAEKERTTVGHIFTKYGRNITVRKPTGRTTQFFTQPLTQVKRARVSPVELDLQPQWGPRRTQSRLLDQCAICGSPTTVEMHHVRHIRKRGTRVRGFTLYLAALNRKQLPVCQPCHRDIHAGKYDGASLAAIVDRIQAARTDSTGAS